MKKVIAWLLVLSLTAAISIGATLAYLTDTDEDVNVMTLGKVKIDQLEYERVDTETQNEDATVQEFHDNKPLIPAVTENGFDYTPGTSYVDWEQIGKDGYTSEIWNPEKINNEVDKMVFVKNEGDYDAYVRSVFAFEAGKYTTLDEFRKMVHLNLNETDYTWKWLSTPVSIPNAEGTENTNYFVAVATYNDVLEPGALTEISLSQIALDKTATNEDVEAFGDTYQVLVKSQGIQADGFIDAETALNEGFGTIATDNIPWENDQPATGPDFWTLLHRYEGGTTDISSKVSKIVFGKPDVHAAAVAGYEPVKFEIGQDVPANVYYVTNGDMYEIYFLSSDVIYTPELCGWLFEELSNLVTLDTTNLDVSRTTSMLRMFTKCTSLTAVDFSHWDTSNVTEFSQMFWGCTGLVTAEIGDWDTGNGIAFNSMFSYCSKLNLDKDELKGWDMSKAEKLNHMFYECLALEEMDLSGWNVTNVTTTSHMFCDCNSLASVQFDGWQTPKLISMDGMFNDCHSLTELDVSSFDTSNCRELSQIFEACKNLETIKGLENWNTENAGTFEQTFSGCTSLKELDLSSFNTRNVVNDYYPMLNGSTGWGFKQMFYGMTSLEKLTLGADFTFDGDGKVTTESYKVSLPDPVAKEGFAAKWQNVDTGALYLPSEVPEETAATYVPYYEYVPKGATMKNALHYLNADPSGTKITAKVANVTFGLNKDYPEIVNSDQGALVDVEQDTPAYAYYVKNGSTYDVYVLSDGIIYAPAKSQKLFASMSNLKTVKGDLDTSRVYTMEGMFDFCGELQSVDCADWDTGNVTSMKYMFYGCGSLRNLDVVDWDVSNVKIFYQLFYSCKKLRSLDLSKWDVSNVEDFKYAFGNCYALTTIDLSNWNPANATTLYGLFSECTSLTDVNLSSWKIGSENPDTVGTNLEAMFSGCSSLENVNLTGWDVSRVTKVKNMFYGCATLKTLDLSGWDMPKLTSTNHMLAGCNSLTSVDFTGWNTPALTSMSAMFSDCWRLTTVDVSSFDTANCTEFARVFEACWCLQTIIGLENWDTEKAGTFEQIFSECSDLKEINLSSFSTKSVVNEHPMQNNVTGHAFMGMFSGLNAIEKLTLSAEFSFDNEGTIHTYPAVLPAPAAKEGFTAKWRNVETGELYDASEIPEKVAATYEAYYEAIPTT